MRLPSNAPRTWSGTQTEVARKAEKMEKAVAYLLDTHRRQDAGQNVDTLTQGSDETLSPKNPGHATT